MVRILIDKVSNMQKEVDNVSKKVKILRKYQKEMAEVKNCNRNEECL